MQGDRVLQAFARIAVSAAGALGDPETFVGHVGGDDFVVITDPTRAEPVAQEICDRFDRVVPDFYHPDDLRAGYIEVADRRGHITKFGTLSVSIGIATDRTRSSAHPTEPVALATEMKSYAKAASHGLSNWAIDRRNEDDTDA